MGKDPFHITLSRHIYITDIYNNFSLHKYSKPKTFYSLGEIQPIDWQLKKRIFLFRISINKSSNPWLAHQPPSFLAFLLWNRDQVSASSLFLLHLVLSCPYQILVQQFHKDFNFSYFLLKFSSPSFEISCPPLLLILLQLIFCNLHSKITSLTLLALCLLLTYSMSTTSSTPQRNETASFSVPKRGKIKAQIFGNLVKALVSVVKPGDQERNMGTEVGGSSAPPTAPPNAYNSDGSPNIW